jgi:hypothetical protein
VIGVNDHGHTWESRLDHWCTLHPEKLNDRRFRWAEKRKEMLASLGRSRHWDPVVVWSCKNKKGVDRHYTGVTTGTTSLYAVTVALRMLNCPGVVLVGVPMEDGENRFRPGRTWKPGRQVRAWEMRELRGPDSPVRSMSGATRRWFGEPDAAWLRKMSVDIREGTRVAS